MGLSRRLKDPKYLVTFKAAIDHGSLSLILEQWRTASPSRQRQLLCGMGLLTSQKLISRLMVELTDPVKLNQCLSFALRLHKPSERFTNDLMEKKLCKGLSSALSKETTDGHA